MAAITIGSDLFLPVAQFLLQNGANAFELENPLTLQTAYEFAKVSIPYRRACRQLLVLMEEYKPARPSIVLALVMPTTSGGKIEMM